MTGGKNAGWPQAPFAFHDGRLRCEDVDLGAIADSHGTPCYVYSAGGMRARLKALQDAFAHRPTLFCYAVKANSNLAVIRTLAREGAGADTVSGGEIERALAAGVPPHKIVFAGVAKGDDEIVFALEAGIHQFNVESVPELRRIDELASARGLKAPVALRLNPDVAAATHTKISTGRKGDKFGIPIDDAGAIYHEMRGMAGIKPVGVHLHIGSQITDLAPFSAAWKRGADLLRDLQRAGIAARRLDLGGGFGVRYAEEQPLDPRDIAALVDEVTEGLDCELMFEPGRSLVAEAGVLLASVIYTKETASRDFVILDAGMNVLLRPALYDAWHDILPLREAPAGAVPAPYDVVGPICESSDILGKGRLLPPLAPGDRVALTGAGAYGAVMASDYNSRRSAVEVLVDGDRHAVIRPARPPAMQFADEIVPDWLDGGGT